MAESFTAALLYHQKSYQDGLRYGLPHSDLTRSALRSSICQCERPSLRPPDVEELSSPSHLRFSSCTGIRTQFGHLMLSGSDSSTRGTGIDDELSFNQWVGDGLSPINDSAILPLCRRPLCHQGYRSVRLGWAIDDLLDQYCLTVARALVLFQSY